MGFKKINRLLPSPSTQPSTQSTRAIQIALPRPTHILLSFNEGFWTMPMNGNDIHIQLSNSSDARHNVLDSYWIKIDPLLEKIRKFDYILNEAEKLGIVDLNVIALFIMLIPQMIEQMTQ